LTAIGRHLYRAHNTVERLFERLKDFRWVAIRYDFLAAVCLGATRYYYGLWVWTCSPKVRYILHLNDEQNKII